jgi:hypothetical protein
LNEILPDFYASFRELKNQYQEYSLLTISWVRVSIRDNRILLSLVSMHEASVKNLLGDRGDQFLVKNLLLGTNNDYIRLQGNQNVIFNSWVASDV